MSHTGSPAPNKGLDESSSTRSAPLSSLDGADVPQNIDRYKESISKSTHSLKEKLIARNDSVKELSRGVQREMSAGIAGIARMIAQKRAGVSVPSSNGTLGTMGEDDTPVLSPWLERFQKK